MPVVSRTFQLCASCLRRQGESESLRLAEGRECFVCGGMMERIPSIAKEVVKVARRYEFETFMVGVSLAEGVQEREDELRSALRIMGKETLKTQVAKMAADYVLSSLDKRVDKMKPDLALLVDLGRNHVTATSRPLFFCARYSKPQGIPQKREVCRACSGTGCASCRNAGYRRVASVEGLVASKLAKLTGSDNVRFTWMGSEDRDSRVAFPGRPFVVEIKNPVRRRLPRGFIVTTGKGRVRVTSGELMPGRPIRLPPFRFRTKIYGQALERPTSEALSELRDRFTMASVRFDRPDGRPAEKKVYALSARVRGDALTIDAELDGGLPVKRLVSGELVSPSVSEVLKTEVRCRKFDICGVEETGKFEFAEIARSQKKN